MSDIASFHVTYDRGSDVLYIRTQREAATAERGFEDRFGIVWRYDGVGQVIGATVVDFHDHWGDRMPHLVAQLAEKFDLPRLAAETVLRQLK